MSNSVATLLAPEAPATGHRTGRRISSTMIDVSICIANWNCRDLLRDCLKSIFNQSQGASLEVLIADNASSDGAADMVAAEFPQVKLIRNSDNRGFAAGSNQAASQSTGRYLFFLNNDTVLPPETLGKLVAFADAHPKVGMLGPRLRDGEGKIQISHRRKPTLKALMHRVSFIRWTSIFRRAYDDYRRDGFDPTQVRRVDVLMGAAVLIPRTVYETCGGWDEGFRFGVEDVELSDRIGRQFPLVHVPGVEVTHYGRVSSRQNPTFAAPNLMIGYVRYFRKSGCSRIGLNVYKLMFTCDVPLQLAGKSLQYLWRLISGASTEKAEKSREAIRGGWHFLRRDLGRFWQA